MEYDHHFIPANNPAFEYYGRWVPTPNQLRKDASFPGSYAEFEIYNTTSLYVSLTNVLNDVNLDQKAHKIDTRQIFILPAQESTTSSAAASLLIEINDGTSFYFNQTGHDVLVVSLELDSSIPHKIRITYLSPDEGAGTLEFGGIWVDNGGHITAGRTNPPTDDALGVQVSSASLIGSPERHFEVVTSLTYADPPQVINSWPRRLAYDFNAHHAIFPTLSYCLTNTCPSSETLISDMYFRAGTPVTSHSKIPYRPGPTPPSALVLDIGLLDYHAFLSSKPSSNAIKTFPNTFVQQYTGFISTIRSIAYPYHSRYLTRQHGTLAVDASFTYNSAPSTLPIFLMTPFTPSKRVHRLLSHALSEVVNTLQRQGDKSTFWIDTSGWLTQEDYIDPAQSAEQERAPDTQNTQLSRITPLPSLTSQAHRKIAKYLSHHLCPYLSPPTPKSDTNDTASHLSSASSLCPFNKHDNYLGHLYLPTEAGMGKMLEERKVGLVKKFLGMESILP